MAPRKQPARTNHKTVQTFAVQSKLKRVPRRRITPRLFHADLWSFVIPNVMTRGLDDQGVAIRYLSNPVLEKIRRSSILGYWRSVLNHGVSESTVYCAINYFALLVESTTLVRKITNSGQRSPERVVTLLSTLAFRLAVKMEEPPEVVYPTLAGPMFAGHTQEEMNEVESHCLAELTPFTAPLVPEWLSTILEIGDRLKVLPPGDSGAAQSFESLVRYIMAIGTIAPMTNSTRKVSSLAHVCASVALACKIWNGFPRSPVGQRPFDKYPEWDERLARAMGKSYRDLKGRIASLSKAMRMELSEYQILKDLDSLSQPLFGTWAIHTWK